MTVLVSSNFAFNIQRIFKRINESMFLMKSSENHSLSDDSWGNRN